MPRKSAPRGDMRREVINHVITKSGKYDAIRIIHYIFLLYLATLLRLLPPLTVSHRPTPSIDRPRSLLLFTASRVRHILVLKLAGFNIHVESTELNGCLALLCPSRPLPLLGSRSVRDAVFSATLAVRAAAFTASLRLSSSRIPSTSITRSCSYSASRAASAFRSALTFSLVREVSYRNCCLRPGFRRSC